MGDTPSANPSILDLEPLSCLPETNATATITISVPEGPRTHMIPNTIYLIVVFGP